MKNYVGTVLACVWLLSGRALAEKPKDCHLLLEASLDLQFDRAGAPRIPVAIEGKDKLVLVDTGGIFSMVTDGTVSELGLKRMDVMPNQFKLINGKSLNGAAVVNSFQIGRMSLNRYPFLILPADRVDEGTAGTLAPDVMGQFDVEFDFAAKKFNLFSPVHCPGDVVYWTRTSYVAIPFDRNAWGQIEFEAILDGQTINVALDTGSSISSMTIESARKIYEWHTDPPELKRLDNDTSEDKAIYQYPFKSLGFQGVAVLNPNIVLVHDKLDDPHFPAFILGMTVISKLHLYIAYKEKVIYITPADSR